MNIQTVADNLRNTIAGKEKMLTEYTKPENYNWLPQPQKTARDAVNAFLKINIAELKLILQDVEQCADECEEFTNYEKWDGDE